MRKRRRISLIEMKEKHHSARVPRVVSSATVQYEFVSTRPEAVESLDTQAPTSCSMSRFHPPRSNILTYHSEFRTPHCDSLRSHAWLPPANHTSPRLVFLECHLSALNYSHRVGYFDFLKIAPKLPRKCKLQIHIATFCPKSSKIQAKSASPQAKRKMSKNPTQNRP